ncbi:MAG: hypothetical protein JW834_02885 [Candidatus Diapherotrites archaeon]|nr:hypothetical protein [Candidatus Diapherotrites archaeon]
MAIVKKIVDDIYDTIEDFFTAVVGVLLITFIVGQFYGAYYAKSSMFWYPIYAFGLLLVYKLISDFVESRRRGKDKDEKKD